MKVVSKKTGLEHVISEEVWKAIVSRGDSSKYKVLSAKKNLESSKDLKSAKNAAKDQKQTKNAVEDLKLAGKS